MSADPDAAAGAATDQHTHLQYLLVTIAIAVWQGMIGVLVKWSTWPPVTMVWARCLVTVVALFAFARRYPLPAGPDASTQRHGWLATWGSGVLLAGHWITLFLGYRVCNVGPVVVALFTFPVMAALIEPWFFDKRPQAVQLLSACVATAGVACMRLWEDNAAPADANTGLGITLGLCSAALFTARSIIARRLLRRASATQIMHEQAIVVSLLLLPSVALLDASHLNVRELLLVLVLGVGFTAIPHTLGVWSMKKLSVATSGIVGSLQTVSTLMLAQIFVGEVVAFGVWVGASVVIVAVAVESLYRLSISERKTNSSK